MLDQLKVFLANIFIGSVPTVLFKILYISLLIIFFISVVSWFYRRFLCVFDAGWSSYSIRNVFRLVFCIVFLLLCIFSVINLFTGTTLKFSANPYMIFVISINTLYTVTTLGSSYLSGYKKERSLVNAFLFSTWCISIVSLYFLSIRYNNICGFAVKKATLWEFGLEIYSRLNPFTSKYASNAFYNIFFTFFINFFNAINMLVLFIFSFKLKGLKEKLVSVRYLIIINSTIFIRDILYYSLMFTKLSSSLFAAKVIGTSISILLIITTCYFIKFIQCEGKYDRNLKKERVQSIKKDVNDLVKDISKISTTHAYSNCKKRMTSLLKRIEILNIKVDISKLAKIRNNKQLQDIFDKILVEAKLIIKD